jgi:hypothetical protein
VRSRRVGLYRVRRRAVVPASDWSRIAVEDVDAPWHQECFGFARLRNVAVNGISRVTRMSRS